MDKNIFTYFANYIHKHTGIIYNEHNGHGLETRLNDLAKMLFIESVEVLYEKFIKDMTSEMHTQLIDLATNNETCFFRDRLPFENLVTNLLPEMVKKKSNKNITIWSAACSTGQEPYSIAININERLNHLWSTHNIKIDASDISPRVLKQANAGTYSQIQIQRGLPITMLQKYFHPGQDNKWEINNDIKKRINYFPFNFLTNVFPILKYDIIFCRNVLIYQKIENRVTIIKNIYNALNEGGYLLMGAGESLLKINDNFQQINTNHGIVYQKNTKYLSS